MGLSKHQVNDACRASVTANRLIVGFGFLGGVVVPEAAEMVLQNGVRLLSLATGSLLPPTHVYLSNILCSCKRSFVVLLVSGSKPSL